MNTLDPLARLELGQFGIEYEDLPTVEATKDFEDGKMYRSRGEPTKIFIWRKSGQWDIFLWT